MPVKALFCCIFAIRGRFIESALRVLSVSKTLAKAGLRGFRVDAVVKLSL